MARSSALSSVSMDALQNELARRKGSVGTLLRERDKLAKQLAKLDAKIESMGGSVDGARGGGRGGPRKRPRNEVKLVDALAAVLKGKTMSVIEAADAVQEAGYQTSSPSFRVIVNQTLINSGKFKRVARGQYTAK